MSLLLFVPALLYPSLWIHTSWETAWIQAQVISSSTWRKKSSKIVRLCELGSVSYISVVQSGGEKFMQVMQGLAVWLDRCFVNPAAQAHSVFLSGLSSG